MAKQSLSASFHLAEFLKTLNSMKWPLVGVATAGAVGLSILPTQDAQSATSAYPEIKADQMVEVTAKQAFCTTGVAEKALGAGHLERVIEYEGQKYTLKCM